MKSSDEGFQDSYFDDPSSELSSEPRKSRFVLLIGVLISTFAFGTTLATNVNLGSSDPLEFGQGVQLLAACSGSSPITVTPTQEFVNRAGAGDYYISGFTVANVPQSCANKDFQIKTYDSVTASALALFPDRRTNVLVNYNGTDFVARGMSSCHYTVITISNSEFRVRITNPSETATHFSKLTFESDFEFFETSTGTSGNLCIGLNGQTSITPDPNMAPSISSTPDSATVGSTISIYGTGFTNDSTVKFWRNRIANFVLNSSTHLSVEVPLGATTGRIVVTTPNGQAVSATTLVITP